MRNIILCALLVAIPCFGMENQLDLNNPDYIFAIDDHITIHHLKLAISRTDNIPMMAITIIPVAQPTIVPTDDRASVNTLRDRYQTDFFYVRRNNNTPPLLLMIINEQD